MPDLPDCLRNENFAGKTEFLTGSKLSTYCGSSTQIIVFNIFHVSFSINYAINDEK